MSKIKSQTEQKHNVSTFLRDNWITIAILLYLVSPVDLISEGIFPIVGSADDAVAVLIEIVRLWKKSRS